MEVWKDMKGFEDKYSISNFGHVYSKLSGRMKSQWKNKDGYCIVTLYLESNNTCKQFLVHRLVALHFLDKPDQFNEVNHLDGIKSNNRFDNLEWCDRSINCQHAYDKGLNPKCYGEKNGRSKLSEIEVEEIRQLKGKLSGPKVAEMYGVWNTMIYRIWNGQNWKRSKNETK